MWREEVHEMVDEIIRSIYLDIDTLFILQSSSLTIHF